MPFCKKCGNKLEDVAVFCPNCGTPVINTKSPKQNKEETTDNYKTQVRGKTQSYGVSNLENLPEGHIIDDRYEIKQKIGQGGFGAVYLVYDRNMNIDKALKIIPEAISSDKEAMFDLQNEAQTMIALNNPNIVRVYDFHKTGDIKFIDMEYIDGKTLTELKLEYKNKQIPEEQVRELALQIASGMSYAHQNGILHKDIKPQNVILTEGNNVKIMDFGIAETVRTSMSRIQNSSSSGTLVYMSPEQIKGKDVGKESDIYSFGAMLYELLSGHPPFYKGATEHQILSEKPEPLKKVSDKMNELILKCLEKDYKDRFKNFGEILKSLGKKDVKYRFAKPKKIHEKTNNPFSRFFNAFLWLILSAIILSLSREMFWGPVISLLIGCYFIYNKWREIKTFELIIYWIGTTILVLIIIIYIIDYSGFESVILPSIILLIISTCFMISFYKKNIINSFLKFWIYQNLLIIIWFFIFKSEQEGSFQLLSIIFIYLNSVICWILSKEKGRKIKAINISIGVFLIIIVIIFTVIYLIPLIRDEIAWKTYKRNKNIEWDRTFGGNNFDCASSIIQTNDGGYAVVGETESKGAGKGDVWLLKLDSNGEKEWDKTFGGSEDDWISIIVQTKNSNFILAGTTESKGAGKGDVWIIKLDTNGEIDWDKTFGGNNLDCASSIIQTNDGGYAVVGETESKGAGERDVWLLKLDTNGEKEWDKTFGGSDPESASSIIQTNDGGYAIVGGTQDGNFSKSDPLRRFIWFIKLDSNGEKEWDKAYLKNYNKLIDWGSCFIQEITNGYLITGASSLKDSENSDIWVIKLDTNGEIDWDKTFDRKNDDNPESFIKTKDDGYAILCNANSDIWVIKLDTNGEIDWDRTFGGSGYDQAYSIIQTNDGGYAVVGRTDSKGAGRADFWMIKFKP